MALAAFATLLGAILQSATGFGFALVLGPVAFAVFEPADALAILLICGAVLSVVVLYAERRPREIRGETIGPLLLAALPGLLVGVLILAALSKPTLQVAVGLSVLAAAAFQPSAGSRASTTRRGTSPLFGTVAVGFLTGILTTTTSTNGPPLVLWFGRLGLTPAQTRDSLAAAFLALDVLGALVLGLIGTADPSPPFASLGALAGLTVLGGILGRRLFWRLDARRFHRVGLLLVVAAGLASVGAGLAG